MTEDMLFDIVADFDLDRLAALISGEATGSGAVATSCTDQDCFEAAFAACTPASYRTPEMVGARARYEVIGPAEGPLADRDRVLVRLMLGTGVRLSSALGLDVGAGKAAAPKGTRLITLCGASSCILIPTP